MRFMILLLTFIFCTGVQVNAAIKTETVEYRDGDTVLEGYIAYDSKLAAKRPGVLVVHEWTGVGSHVKKSAEKLAAMGYTALAVDIYGKGVRPVPPQAGEVAGKYKSDRPLLRRRIQAGLDFLNQHKTVDSKRIAAIGYCFGGTTVLELARSGAAVKGVVSFHGGLDSPTPADAKNIKGKVLVLHGADDPYVPADQVAAFENEMRSNKLDWELVKYSNAVHSFTNPDAGSDNSKGAAYNAEADKRSWARMSAFLKEIF